MIVRYTRQSLADLEHARSYISAERPDAAAAIGRRISMAIDGLARFPSRGRAGRVSGTRELAVPRTPFVVAYRVTASQVEVLAILHGARAWPSEFG